MEAYIGSIILFAGNFAPRGWAFCQGQILSIAQNTALFSLLGTTYGGNGQTTFALPDLRGRAPIGQGQGPGLPNITLGEMAGSPTTTLLITNMPAHNHVATASVSAAADGRASSDSPADAYLDSGTQLYTNQSDGTKMNAGMVSVQIGIAGGNQPFSIQDPYLGMNYIICMEGIFPSRN